MKGFGKIALMFGLLGGLMACFIIPVQISRNRTLSPTEKAQYALTVYYYKRHCDAVSEDPNLRPREPGGHLGGLRCHAATSGAGDWLTSLVPLHERALAHLPLSCNPCVAAT
jgi:hypothetical protein